MPNKKPDLKRLTSLLLVALAAACLLLYATTGLEGLCLFMIFGCLLLAVWLLRQEQRRAAHNQLLLDQANTLRQVDTLLLSAARQPERLTEALQAMAEGLQAHAAFLLLRAYGEQQPYLWRDTPPRHDPDVLRILLDLGDAVGPDGTLTEYDTARLQSQYGIPAECGLHSLMLAPVVDSDANIIGVLGVAHLDRVWPDATPLQTVMPSFSMALYNIESFHAIEDLGVRDRLTGLLNRNAYQLTLARTPADTNDDLTCIYLDADGLHALNNRCGHLSGDEMLQTVARAMGEVLDGMKLYRIGGDEFVALGTGLTAEETTARLAELQERINRRGYHISAGAAHRSECPGNEDLLKLAESRMYRAKQTYYRDRNEDAEARSLDARLEELLQEKRDLEVFRQALRDKYAGVYLVDLALDTARSIYIPPYFAAALHRANGKFSQALVLYSREQVAPADLPAFAAFTQYPALRQALEQDREPELHYHRTDGQRLHLRIRPSPAPNAPLLECLWVFEPEEN